MCGVFFALPCRLATLDGAKNALRAFFLRNAFHAFLVILDMLVFDCILCSLLFPFLDIVVKQMCTLVTRAVMQCLITLVHILF